MNQQILSQDEVDALLQGITGESQKLEQEEQVLSHNVDEVVCRWCGHGRNVVEIADGDLSEEPGAPSRIR